MIKQIIIIFLLSQELCSYGQTVLNADNIANNTYELINSVLAPGASSPAVETPDQIGVSANSSEGSHASFGRHIQEVYDATLAKNVFAFYAHLASDNDVSTTSTDRQRIEIKTFSSSPANLKGTTGEIIQYKWQFKIPSAWKPSSAFTHIHQVKAVGGDDSDPIFTLTLRKGTSGSPSNKIEVIYDQGTNGSAVKKRVENLSLFEDIWVEATETITVGPSGTYDINIKRISDGLSLLSYTETNIETLRPTNTFIRPKWGIYRSIATPSDLRDEVLYLSDIIIQELSALPVVLSSFSLKKSNDAITLKWQSHSEVNLSHYLIQKSSNGIDFQNLATISPQQKAGIRQYQFSDKFPTSGIHYYKLLSVDLDGTVGLNEIRVINYGINSEFSIYPNPALGKVNVLGTIKGDFIKIFDALGRIIKAEEFLGEENLSIDINNTTQGLYILVIERDKKVVFSARLMKI
ncbi:hypothetical protein PBAC_10880 [Pedobacter glucosidilyticus]|nr:T9SS type A sorting domain-containing protein [Pedobacter glucosidilyticus]KHJ38749.1 hypothetical protein PBAC_10880 [Pedobacter glucosidilyticus]